jgi:hypothetical protein
MKQLFSLNLFISLFVCALLCSPQVVSLSHANMINQLYAGIDIDTNWGDTFSRGSFGTFTYGDSKVELGPTLIDVTNSSSSYSSQGIIHWIWEGTIPVLVNLSFNYYYPFPIGFDWIRINYENRLDPSQHSFVRTILLEPNEFFFLWCWVSSIGHASITDISVSASPVPVPGAIVLFGSALALVLYYRRRQP